MNDLQYHYYFHSLFHFTSQPLPPTVLDWLTISLDVSCIFLTSTYLLLVTRNISNMPNMTCTHTYQQAWCMNPCKVQLGIWIKMMIGPEVSNVLTHDGELISIAGWKWSTSLRWQPELTLNQLHQMSSESLLAYRVDEKDWYMLTHVNTCLHQYILSNCSKCD